MTDSDCTRTADTTNFIVFKSGLTGAIALGSTLPTITSGTDLTITGPTTSSAGIAIDGGHSVRLMQVNSGATLNLQYLTLQNGGAVGASCDSVSGGAIANEGTLTIANSTFSANQAIGGACSISAIAPGQGSGGAIFNAGTLTITSSTFSANQAAGGGGTGSAYGYGGAIANDGTSTITNSTFSANQAMGETGGAIANDGTLTITNSTFSANQAGDYYGGAIFNDGGTTTITSSTLSGNNAGYGGGGIYSNADSVSIKGTILAANTPDNCEGSPVDVGYNISDDGTCGFSATGSAANGINVDPMLAALADNGGPTMTFALESGSPAIDAIPVADCTDQASNPIATDQRGMPRPDAGEVVCDIGAYEFQVKFAGTPGATNCNGQSVSALSNQYGTLDAAALALGYPSVKALQTDIKAYCAL